MEYPIYQNPPSEIMLNQGDILIPELLRENLKGHQDYFVDRPYFYRYMILTQTCDLDRTREMADFISVAVIRRLHEVIDIRYVENNRARNKTDNLLRDLFNHNYNKRGLFYLPNDTSKGIEVDSVADLRVIFSLHKAHYSDLLNSRCGSITDVYAAQLGHIIGYMFNRVATKGWDELNPNCAIKDQIKVVRENIQSRVNDRLQSLLSINENRCIICGCTQKATTYRWLPIGSQNNETEWEEHTMCSDHASQWDEKNLPLHATLRPNKDKIDLD